MFREIYMLFCGMQECEPFYSFGPAVRDCYLIHFCLSGEGDYYAGNYRYHIEEGSGFLITPGELTFYQADGEHPWTYLWIAVGGTEAEKFLALAGISRKTPVFRSARKDRMEKIIEEMLRHHTMSCSNELYIQGLLMQFLACLTEESGVSGGQGERTDNLYISRAISYIHKNYQNPLTVQEIADYLNLNRSYLTELFVKNLHFSPQQFLMKYRMTKGAELLLKTELPVSHVAYSCGYSSGMAFGKAFKKVTGQSPMEYRKQKKLPAGEKLRRRDPHENFYDSASSRYSRE